MSDCPSCASGPGLPFGHKDGFSLLTCETCELTYVDPMPTSAELAEFYREYYKTRQYRGKLDSKVRRARRRIRRLKRGLTGSRFIDVGCNVGFAVEAARQSGFQAKGIDIDEVAIDEARTLFPGCRFEHTSVETLASSGQRYDVVYCSEVIEHLPNLAIFLEAIRRLISDDGLAFITTPDLGHRSIRRDPYADDFIRPPEHLLYFTRRSIERVMRGHGFTRVRFQHSFKPTLKVVAR